MKFKVGDRVSCLMINELYGYTGELPPPMFIKYNINNGLPISGTITSIQKDFYNIKWDKEYSKDMLEDIKNGVIKKKHFNDITLISEDEAKKLYYNLEDEYKVLEEHIKEKMSAAAQMIKEADVLAKKQNKELRVFYNALYPLKSAMKSVGWNNSSFNC